MDSEERGHFVGAGSSFALGGAAERESENRRLTLCLVVHNSAEKKKGSGASPGGHPCIYAELWLKPVAHVGGRSVQLCRMGVTARSRTGQLGSAE